MPAMRTRRVSLRPGGSSSSPPRAPRTHASYSSDPAEAAVLAAATALARAPAPAVNTARPSTHQPTGRAATESLVTETKHLLSALDPLASTYHPRHRARRSSFSKSDDASRVAAPSLAAFKAQLLARSAPSTRRSSLPATEDHASAAQVDWQMYRDWPEGLAQEEEAVHTYFQRLKFIFLEQATKLTFLNDCHEDPDTGKEGVVHDHSSVRQLEEKASLAKAELAEAKAQVRAVRAEIDEQVIAIAHPWAQLESEATEARALISDLADMELELAKIRATSGRSRRRSSGEQRNDPTPSMDEEDVLPGTADVDATVPPAMGTLTVPEAEAFCEAQLERMQDLAAETEKLGGQAKEAEGALKSALRRAERKQSERKLHEAQLEEMRAGARDLRIEQLCTSRTALLSLLRSALGVINVSSPSATELHVTYLVPSQERQVKLVLTYRPDGGALDHYCVVDPTDESDTPLDDAHVALLDGASEANQPTALVHRLWAACAQQAEAA